MENYIPKNPNLTLDQVENGFKNKKKKSWHPLLFVFKTLGLFVILTIVIFYGLNAPAYLKKSKFIQNPNQFNQLLNIPEDKKSVPGELVLPILYPVDLTDNTIYIPKISVKAPIIWGVDENNMMEELKSGVVQYTGTALPGQLGNVFIFGHSSNYWWVESAYNDIFALLDKVEIGDKIYITYLGREYIYQIDNKKVVRPDQVEVMNPTTDETVTLMTCVPVGTSLNRLIITGQQISPKQNEEAEQLLPSTILPSTN